MEILIVDDHPLVREALRGALGALVPEATFLEEADGAGAVRRLGRHADVALVVLDLGLPDRDGLELLAELREARPALPIAVLSADGSRESVTRALELGALGFVPKSAPREILLGAFGLILAGGVYVPPEALAPAARAAPDARACGPALTERQAEVLELMMRGMSNKAICRRLDIAEATVKNHVTAILRALGASNRTEAVVAAGARLRRPAADPFAKP